MKEHITKCLVLVMAAIVLLFVVAVAFGNRSFPDSFLNSTEIVISAATLTSVAFALFSFYEYKELANKLSEMKTVMDEQRKQMQYNIDLACGCFFDSADVIYKDIYDQLCSTKRASEEFNAAALAISISMARLGLESGSFQRIRNAMTILFKHDKILFLQSEAKIRYHALKMTVEERNATIDQFEDLKRMVLKDYSKRM